MYPMNPVRDAARDLEAHGVSNLVGRMRAPRDPFSLTHTSAWAFFLLLPPNAEESLSKIDVLFFFLRDPFQERYERKGKEKRQPRARIVRRPIRTAMFATRYMHQGQAAPQAHQTHPPVVGNETKQPTNSTEASTPTEYLVYPTLPAPRLKTGRGLPR
jgi:hypothetical protein